jgi:RimJ/RimL family protein N-acetyltransferase
MGLGVWPDNKQAISAYEKLGFVAGGEPMPSRSIPGLLYLPMFREIGGESNE